MIWALVRTAALQRDLRQARVRALDASGPRAPPDPARLARQRPAAPGQRRIQLGLLAERSASDDDRASIDELGRGLEDALADIRSVTRDGAPRTLAGFGVTEALRSVGRPGSASRADRCGRRSAAIRPRLSGPSTTPRRGPPEQRQARRPECGGSGRVARQPVERLVRRRGLRGRVREGDGPAREPGSRTWPIGSAPSAAVSPSIHISARARASAGRSRFEHGQRRPCSAERSRSGVLRRCAFTGGRYRRRGTPGIQPRGAPRAPASGRASATGSIPAFARSRTMKVNGGLSSQTGPCGSRRGTASRCRG